MKLHEALGDLRSRLKAVALPLALMVNAALAVG
jgi:hypothetical protein